MTRASRSRSIRHSDRILQGLRGTLLALCLCLTAGMAVAQGLVQSPVLTIDPDRLYAESDYGKQSTREIEALGADLAAENRKIEDELTAEEKALTEQRKTMAAVDFRKLADAFDEKVQDIRRRQDAKARELNRRLEERQDAFLGAAAPVLEQLMRESGAALILERRSVFLSANAIDITQVAIDRLNAADITGPQQ